MRLRSKKLETADQVVRIIRELCRLVFNVTSEAGIEKLFGLTQKQLEAGIREIVDALPDRVFQPDYRRRLEELKTICAREFIFFQVQEKVGDPNYKKDLANFVAVFSKDIEKKV